MRLEHQVELPGLCPITRFTILRINDFRREQRSLCLGCVLKQSIYKDIHVIRTFDSKMSRDCIEDCWFLILQEVIQPVALLGCLVID